MIIKDDDQHVVLSQKIADGGTVIIIIFHQRHHRRISLCRSMSTPLKINWKNFPHAKQTQRKESAVEVKGEKR